MSTSASRPPLPGHFALPGMTCLDTSRNERIPVLMQMVGALSRATEPQEVLRAFADGWSRIQKPEGYVSLSTRGLADGQYRITRLLHQGLAGVTNDDTWSDRDRIPVREGGFFGGLIRQAYPEVIHHFNLRNDPVVGDKLASYGSMMALPLFEHGEPLNWAIILRDDATGFSEKDLEEAILRSNLIGTSVRNVLATKQLRDANTRIRREMDQIATIQQALLPKSIPSIPGLTISTSYEVYDLAGGDYYDLIPLDGRPDGRWGVMIADAAGHGPAAAVLMAIVQTLLHSYPRVPDSASEVMTHLNHHLVAKGITSSFVTSFFAIYDPSTRALQYARAGHPPALVKHPGSGGAVDRLDAVGGLPLGVLDDTTYDDATITLESGQTLVLYTDGITEAFDANGAMFGVDGIADALETCTGAPDCVRGTVGNALRAHQGAVKPSDDQTMVAMRVDDGADA